MGDDPRFKPVEKKSLADAVFEQLRDEIVSGRMEPGDALPAERGLSDMLGVNRGAVREALKRLEQARLIIIQQGGATRVQNYLETAGTDLLEALLMRADGTIDARVARGVMEMRSAVASDIARLAARRATPEAVDEVAPILDEMEQRSDDLVALQDLSMDFWRALSAIADNVAYQLSLNSLSQTYDKFKRLLTHVLAEEFTDTALYREVLDAVRARDEEEAAHVAREIASVGEARINEVLAALEQAAAEG